jgi:hypothetical protein
VLVGSLGDVELASECGVGQPILGHPLCISVLGDQIA